MKRIFALLLGLVLISVPINVSAVSIEEEKAIVRQTEYEYVTDIDKLLEKADKQSRSFSSVKTPNNQLSLEVRQLISETTYSDNSIEKDYAISDIRLMAAGDGYFPKYWGAYDIACTYTAYVTEYWKNGLQGFRLNYTTFVFNDANSNPVTIKKLEMSTHGIYDPTSQPNIERFLTENYPVSGRTYRLNSDDSRVYYGGGFQQLYCGAIVTLSNGNTSPYGVMQVTLFR